jgi:signal transduction histidine kinase
MTGVAGAGRPVRRRDVPKLKSRGKRRPARAWRVGRSSVRPAVLVTAAASLAVTALVAFTPSLRFAYRNPDLHVALLTGESLVALLAAFLVSGRFDRRRRLDDLVLCSGLAVVGLATLLFGAVPAILGTDTSVFSTWSASAGRLLGAVLIMVAALAPDRRVRVARGDVVALVATHAVALAATALVVALLEPHLPRAIDPLATPERSVAPRLTGHWAILGTQLVGTVLYSFAAAGFLRRAERRRDQFSAWLAVGAVLAAAARLNYCLFPSAFTEYVYSGDAFRLLFYLVVLAAATNEIRGTWRVAARAAALEERRRVARDLHDGLAQELASVRRNLQWLDAQDPFVARAAAASHRAFAEARRAIAALSEVSERPVHDVLAQTARSIAEREGAEVLLDLAPTVRLESPECEALRLIAAEAITNAARHGEAKVVRLRLEDGRRVRMTVTDDGRGFDPERTARRGDGGFGLESMRDRAARVGGTFAVRSAPNEGAHVEVRL